MPKGYQKDDSQDKGTYLPAQGQLVLVPMLEEGSRGDLDLWKPCGVTSKFHVSLGATNMACEPLVEPDDSSMTSIRDLVQEV